MSEPIYRYIPSEKSDSTAEILRMVVYPPTHPEYMDSVVLENAPSFNTALHITSAQNNAELTNIGSKIGGTTVPQNKYKNRYTVQDKQWDTGQLLQDIADNNFMLRVDNHTVFFSIYSNQRKATEVTMMHYKTPVMELAVSRNEVLTITLKMGDDPTSATLKRVNSVLRDFGWVLKYHRTEDAFGDSLSVLRLQQDWPGGWHVNYEDHMYIDMEYGNVYVPTLDNIIPIQHGNRPAV